MLAALLLITAAAPPKACEVIDRVAVVVNEDIITLSQLKSALDRHKKSNPKTTPKAITRMLIEEQLLVQQAKALKINVTEKEILRAIDSIKAQNQLDDAALKKALKGQGITLEQYKRDLQVQLLRMKLVNMKLRDRVVVTEADVKGAYEASFGKQRKKFARLNIITFKVDGQRDAKQAQADAKKARAQLMSGVPLAQVTKTFSATNQDSGEIALGDLRSDIAKAIEGLKPGAITAPLEAKEAVNLIQLVSQRFGPEVSFGKVKERIRSTLYQQALERAFGRWMEALKSESLIEIRVEDLERAQECA